MPGGASLGMSADQLQQSVRSARRVPHPTRLGGGLVGSWSAAPIDLCGVTLAPTFFFADGELRRVEYLATDAAPSAFDALRRCGRAQWGAELATQDPNAAFASWATADTDIYLQQSTAAQQRPTLRLVMKRRALKDADEL